MCRSCVSVFVLIAAMVFVSLPAFAQDFPKAEVYGGYSYLHIDTQGETTSSITNECNIAFGGTCPVTFHIHPGFNGWNLAAQGNMNRWFGVKAQVSGQYGNILSIKFTSPFSTIPVSLPGQHIYDFLFGPVVSRRENQYTVFAHGLFGAQHVGF